MAKVTHWDWQSPKRMRALKTVEDHILWSYSLLSVSRRMMKECKSSGANILEGGRTKWATIEMSKYISGKRVISNLDRDDILSHNGIRTCSHCGITLNDYHWDHLIPRKQLKGRYLALNQVLSCAACNQNRGAKDLMIWHSERNTFPTLSVLRRYLKLCHQYSHQNGILLMAIESAAESGMPFNPQHLPKKFPPIHDLVWDFAYPGI